MKHEMTICTVPVSDIKPAKYNPPNKVTGDWEFESLADLLQGLAAKDFDVTLTGFDAAEIDDLFSQVHDKDAKDDDYDVNQALELTCTIFRLVINEYSQRNTLREKQTHRPVFVRLASTGIASRKILLCKKKLGS